MNQQIVLPAVGLALGSIIAFPFLPHIQGKEGNPSPTPPPGWPAPPPGRSFATLLPGWLELVSFPLHPGKVYLYTATSPTTRGCYVLVKK